MKVFWLYEFGYSTHLGRHFRFMRWALLFRMLLFYSDEHAECDCEGNGSSSDATAHSSQQLSIVCLYLSVHCVDSDNLFCPWKNDSTARKRCLHNIWMRLFSETLKLPRTVEKAACIDQLTPVLELVLSQCEVQDSCSTQCFAKAEPHLTVGHPLQAMWAWWDFNNIKSLPSYTPFIVWNPTIRFIPLGYMKKKKNTFLDIF